MAIESLDIILKINVGVGEVVSESVGPLHEVSVKVWEWTQRSGQGCRAGVANPRAFRELANHTDVGRCLDKRL